MDLKVISAPDCNCLLVYLSRRTFWPSFGLLGGSCARCCQLKVLRTDKKDGTADLFPCVDLLRLIIFLKADSERSSVRTRTRREETEEVFKEVRAKD